MIDDEHDLYRVMMADLFNQDRYDVKEVKRVEMSKITQKLHDMHYSRRVNKYFEMPFKNIWDRYYDLHKYPFNKEEKYVVIFMNGSLRNYFNKKYLKKIKNNNPNVRLCLLIFDKSIYYGARRAIAMRDVFDYVFSFDAGDCTEFGFERFYSCFSRPYKLEIDKNKESSAFFIGDVGGRLEILQSAFKKITSKVDNCKFYMTGVEEKDKIAIPNVKYNQTMSFYEEMLYSFNSSCLVEILREGQTGISLRVCEAIAFNKKLLTNNKNLKYEPFYDERFMSIFENPEDIDLGFLLDNIEVNYKDSDIFSPIRILDKIIEYEEEK